MIHFQFKGKGILVPVFAIVPLVVGLLATSLIDEYFFNKNFSPSVYPIVGSISVILGGFWNQMASQDYYLDKNGEKQYFYLEHKFMFIQMNFWSYVFWVIGTFGLIGASVEMIAAYLK